MILKFCMSYAIFQIWSEVSIDGHEVIAEYQEPPTNVKDREDPDVDYVWAARHVKQSQYCLQIVRLIVYFSFNNIQY